MECVMHPKIHPAHLPAMLRTQRLELESRIRAISNSHIVHKVRIAVVCQATLSPFSCC
jgi:hypothetical protein